MYHLRFDQAYLVRGGHRSVCRPEPHPTWFELGEPEFTARFGGSLATACSVCSKGLHRLIAIDGFAPELGVGITSRASVTFATCLSCLGWSEDVLQYRHDLRGEPSAIGSLSPRTPRFPSEPLPETTVGLVRTPHQWQDQDWDEADGWENFHRVGGEPTWVQGPAPVACGVCSAPMPFLFQLDSELPTQLTGRRWLWGSGGIAYAFWCDTCATSAYLWQCT